MISRFLLLILLGLFSQIATAFPITSYLEMVKVNSVGYAWKPVPLSNTYTNPVIACTYNLPSAASNDAVVRVRPAGGGFEVLVQRPNDSNAVTASDVYCTVSEAGVYTYPIKYEAHTVSSDQKNSGSNNWSSANMEDVSAAPFKLQNYSKPVVTGQVMSFNNADFSVFWASSCSSRTTPPTNASICVGKHTGFVNSSLPNAETLGYFIAEEAEYYMSNAYVNIALGADSIRGVGDSPPYSYTLPRSFSYATASQNAMDGSDGGWAVLYGNDPVATTLNLAIEEETFANGSQRTHTNEQVAYWVAEPINKTLAELTINEVLYRQATGLPEFVELYAQTSGSIVNYVIAGQDGAAQNHLLPDIEVTAGDYIVFYFARGTNNTVGSTHYLYSQSGANLENSGDDVVLLKPSATDVTVLNGSGTVNAVPVDYVAYGGGGSTDPVPVSNDGVTVGWDAMDVPRLAGAASGQSISLTPNGVDTDSSVCWELTTSGDAAACPGFLVTSDIDASAFIHSEGHTNNFSPLLTLEKTVQTLYDPVNNASNPKTIPGSILEYTITAYNAGPAPADNNSITVSDLIPANTRLCVSAVGFCVPPYFVDGVPGSGLSPGGVGYSDNGGVDFTYSPVADGLGTDGAVTHINMPTMGAFQPLTGGQASNFSMKFRVVVQ